jgi:hypothetical protein
MEIQESRITFSFPEYATTIKFDDSPFYRNSFNHLPGGKGVDFIIDCDKRLIFLEVKNCEGSEVQDRRKTHITRDGRFEDNDDENARNFDVEIPKKVAMTLACLTGAHTKQKNSENAAELEPYFKSLISDKICSSEKELIVILFLEGNFHSSVRTKTAIMQEIQRSIRNKLEWLSSVKVKVVDSNTYNSDYFSIKK